MSITQNKVVSMSYVLKNNEGQVLDQADEQQPFMYLHGSQNIIPTLEAALSGKNVGDTLQVSIPAEQAYGEHSQELVQPVPRAAFAGVPAEHLVVGAHLQAQTDEGVRVVTIAAVDDQNITVDGNHPMAGIDLNFNVKVVAIRDASPEEIAHGHVHTPGMHAH
ncbi:MAG: peptidylprolyl isomerase [Thiofilum sp.]|uniref:FKBP-type peptidyl-prolyl cis-trans isomerase n=1 Tax=Thiofilum sp. TaxID=2212733 RepID=UPI0025FD97E3|nr:peptidylprolyl isomerase [Thiofilum sp.]MBK8452478.1 peptidylprolyl isomerase [Thiofilum sp.]